MVLKLWNKYENIAVFYLNADIKSDNYSKVHGLRAGADDYLTKPFEITEFTARVLSLIRRYTRFNPKMRSHSNFLSKVC